MHIWLPDAYTYAPSAASAVVAPLMTKVMAYVMIRVMFTVFQPEFSISVLQVTDIMVWLVTFAILFGARHSSSREKHEGLVVAIAFETIIKLFALLAVGLFALFGVFGSFNDLQQWLVEHPQKQLELMQPILQFME